MGKTAIFGEFMPLKICVVVGSLREDSYNRRLAYGLEALPEARGATFVHADIGALPLYDQDQDDHPTAEVAALRDLVRGSDGVLFVTPEYNRSIPGVLKNAIDHASRPHGQSAWARKPAGIIGVSIGAAGTGMAQQHLRNVLSYLDMPTLCQPEAHIQWQDGLVADDGTIAESSREFLAGWLTRFLELVAFHQRASSPAEPA
jgi:chromate reductase